MIHVFPVDFTFTKSKYFKYFVKSNVVISTELSGDHSLLEHMIKSIRGCNLEHVIHIL